MPDVALRCVALYAARQGSNLIKSNERSICVVTASGFSRGVRTTRCQGDVGRLEDAESFFRIAKL